MNLREMIRRRLRARARGVDVRGDVNAVVAANVSQPGTSTVASRKQAVVQRTRRTAQTDRRGGSQ